MSLVKIRMDIERALRDIMGLHGEAARRPLGISGRLRELARLGLTPPSTDRFLDAMRTMNEAVHGLDVKPEAAEQAIAVGTEFLSELRAIPRP